MVRISNLSACLVACSCNLCSSVKSVVRDEQHCSNQVLSSGNSMVDPHRLLSVARLHNRRRPFSPSKPHHESTLSHVGDAPITPSQMAMGKTSHPDGYRTIATSR